MMLPFPHFESAIKQRKTMAKGKILFESGASTGTDIISGTTFHVHYPAPDEEDLDYSDYKVVIQIQNGWVSYFNCPCPSTQGPMCEHSIAALYQIRHENVWKSGQDSEEGMRISRGNKKQVQVKYKNPESEEEEGDEDLESEDGDDSDEATHTQKELECQICLNIVKKPVLMGCKSHSVCFSCIESLFNHKKKGRDGKKEIHCPTCGTKSGSLKIRSVKDIKVNKNLQQLKQAYNDDKRKWEDEKLQLQIQIAEMKALKEKLLKDNSSEEKKSYESQEVQASQNLEEVKTNSENIGTQDIKNKAVNNEVNKKAEEGVKENHILINDNKMDLEDNKQENGRMRRNLKRKEFVDDDVQEADPKDKAPKKVLKKVKIQV